MRRLHTKGFTILELLIATTVFSVVLLLAATAMIQIGRTYYKGTEQTRVQEVARDIIDQISKDIQFSGDEISPNGNQVALDDDKLVSPTLPWRETEVEHINYLAPGTFSNANGIQTFCIGKKRYYYVLERILKPQQGPVSTDTLDTWHQVLITYNDPGDVAPAGNPGGIARFPGCPDYHSTDLVTKLTRAEGYTAKELLSPGMLLAKLNVKEVVGSPGLWQIDIRILNTDSHDFIDKSGGFGNWKCKTDKASSQFCAQADLTTTVKKRVE